MWEAEIIWLDIIICSPVERLAVTDSSVTSTLTKMDWGVLEMGLLRANMEAQMLFLCTHFSDYNHTIATGSICD